MNQQQAKDMLAWLEAIYAKLEMQVDLQRQTLGMLRIIERNQPKPPSYWEAKETPE